MSITLIFALVVVAATIYALIKRYETRLVLITAGLAMALFSLKPMVAFQQFDASMTKGSLIIAICSAMGFAAAVALTKCDVHLVALLTRPLRKLGFMLLPACMIVTGLCSVAIPSTAGLCAAVGPSMIPILIRAGFHPAIAAAAIVCSTTPALFNPGGKARRTGDHRSDRSLLHASFLLQSGDRRRPHACVLHLPRLQKASQDS